MSKRRISSAKNHVKYIAGNHMKYLEREGAAKGRKDLEFSVSGNMPSFAGNDPSLFWDAADKHERKNGRLYSEFLVSFPRELNPEQREELLKSFIAETIGDRYPYTAAIHNPIALDGKEQPHAHIMFNTRERDGIERPAEKHFARYNAEHPELGGAKKADEWRALDREASQINRIREAWERHTNKALELAGREERVDRRSLKDRGIDREPEPKMGQAATQHLKAGRDSEVGRIVECLRAEREAAREVERLRRELSRIADRANELKQREEHVKQERNRNSFVRRGKAAELSEPEKREFKRTVDLITERRKNDKGETEYRYKNSEKLVFIDRGQSFELQVVSPTVVRAALQASLEKGWTDIIVRGSEEARREVWLQGQYLGVHVEGYKPREADKALVEHMQEAKAARKANDQQHQITVKQWYELEAIKASQVVKKFEDRIKIRQRDEDIFKEERLVLGAKYNYESKCWEYPAPLTGEKALQQARAEFVGKEKLRELVEKLSELEKKQEDLHGKELKVVQKQFAETEGELRKLAQYAKDPSNANDIERLADEILKADKNRQEAISILESRIQERESLKTQFQALKPYLEAIAKGTPDLQVVVERSSGTGFYRIKNEEYVVKLGKQILLERREGEPERDSHVKQHEEQRSGWDRETHGGLER